MKRRPFPELGPVDVGERERHCDYDTVEDMLVARVDASISDVDTDCDLKKQKPDCTPNRPIEHSGRLRDPGHQDAPEPDQAAKARSEVAERRMERAQTELSLETYPSRQ